MDNRRKDCACLDLLGGRDSKTERINGPGNHTDHGESVSETIHDQEALVSDSESCTTSPFPRKFDCLGDGQILLEEGDKDYSFVKRIFLAGMGSLAKNTSVEAIHRNQHSSFLGKSRLQTFRIYSEAMMKKCGDNINMRFAWYGASKDDICGILQHGFGQYETPENGGLYGYGLYLSPAGSSVNSVASSNADENGLRHVLFCRVILGNLEEVLPGSRQFHPSSEEFDSGVDNQSSPKKYIVWSTHMNTHILPEYTISFRLPSLTTRGFRRTREPLRKPSSAWMPFPKLITMLSGSLPSSTISLIKRHHNDYMEKKITREYLIQRVRQLAGDKLLVAAIRSFRGKVME
ncbi:probable inactive poly [ADP-ribose] polymerase SRO2 [Magnolia sinica]|uniref:probable inactive poly [ADP-ribose] polymerase SRO2 n=1 Tax=Magnolia sinica TaxID=86752 RepID=UPI002659C9CA|nr:probable inactive poly [ADP-ribose] polymerase SRO2 [Magnolia sinica]